MEKYWSYLMLLIVLTLAREGEAIKCWTCNEIYDEACGDPFEPVENGGVTYVLKQCPSRELGPWFTRDETPVCTKIVTQIDYLTLAIRGCSSRGENESSQCLEGIDGVLFCESCEEDGCNSATRVTAVSLLFAPLLLLQIFVQLQNVPSEL